MEEYESQYAAPIVSVSKANGKIRLCIDYKRPNAITVAESYPLPRMDDLLYDTKHTPFMTTVDLQSGYHQAFNSELLRGSFGPFIIVILRSLTSYEVANPTTPDVPVATYVSSCHIIFVHILIPSKQNNNQSRHCEKEVVLLVRLIL
ncbi:transposon Ty3-I Gag-Pol polyprotein [Caerostris darwini]|uniref:Transposon Ty3-I Gag-Pol polyprotein n=1 Tax=Caerostris darwini TaxID=1538125 RepID=A0AAV4UEU7_9ARAC|nr:transposon Ty3-I Gag-Pol polyprotein [Caerostris darwini]